MKWLFAVLFFTPFLAKADTFSFGDWVYSISGDQVTIESYSGLDESPVIPSEIDGNPVTKIGDNAFSVKSYLVGISIPSSVTSIGSSAFQDCHALTNIILPLSITNIGEYAFQNCTGLTSIVIPQNVRSIGHASFIECDGLTNIVIGNKVTNIGSAAFWGCRKVQSIIIPKSVETLGGSAFAWATNLRSVTISGNLTNIGVEPFFACEDIDMVYLLGSGPGAGFSINEMPTNSTFHYAANAMGWGSFNFEGRPTKKITPKILFYETKKTNNIKKNSLRFLAYPGFSYSVQKATNLSEWITKTNVPGEGIEVFYTEDASGASGFYRISQEY